MDIKEKLEINKKIRKYNGKNEFILSLKRNLNSKWCSKIEYNGKEKKVLSDKQYEIVTNLIDQL
jgi:hypothetical protein